MSDRGISWTVEHTPDGERVVFAGEVNEKFDGRTLLQELPTSNARVILDCAGIRRLNSEGIRLWVGFVRELVALDGVTVEYRRCSVAMVSQINMVPALLERVSISSLFAPFVCEETDEEEDRLIECHLVDPHNPPTFPHDGGGVWELNEDPDRYFAFLLHPLTGEYQAVMAPGLAGAQKRDR